MAWLLPGHRRSLFESTCLWHSKYPSPNFLAWKQISAGEEGFPLAFVVSLSRVEFISQDLLLPLVLTPYPQKAWGVCCTFGLLMPLGQRVVIGLLLFCPVWVANDTAGILGLRVHLKVRALSICHLWQKPTVLTTHLICSLLIFITESLFWRSSGFWVIQDAGYYSALLYEANTAPTLENRIHISLPSSLDIATVVNDQGSVSLRICQTTLWPVVRVCVCVYLTNTLCATC